ncbi:hypothetical protein ACQ4M3_05370 [Leptolyngbya sp. AN03gr2]|uniref:hypothetical protein n=1 Tax=unclassified Leptolyngbya TaxID=2650499 RepID=UPI003D319FB6
MGATEELCYQILADSKKFLSIPDERQFSWAVQLWKKYDRYANQKFSRNAIAQRSSDTIL